VILQPDLRPGGKVKPLKAPKKEKKDLDEDELAFKAKQAAGASIWVCLADRVSDRFLQMPKPGKKWPTRQKARDL